MRQTLFEKDIGWRLPAGSGRYVFVCVSLLFLLLAIYGNSLDGEWIFDDGPNIVENVNVHLQHLSWEEIEKTFYIAGGFSRPVSYLSFGINYYFGGLHVFGYHLLNLCIHYITALLLFFVVLRTLNLSLLRDRYAGSAYAVALIATVLWAINPIQVLAVSYIVQRMASLAGMFYLLSLYCYIRGRTGESQRWNIVFFLLSFLSFLLALGSKENAVMLPVVIFFYDLFLIQGVTKERIKKNILFFIVPLSIVFLIALIYTDLSGVIAGYGDRPFTMKERLLTEPRIIIFYLSLIFYPLPSRMAMFYDIELSRSLIEPLITMPAILCILLVNCYALYTARKRPLLAFAIIFFFMNHVIEGSIIPLELIYEHRNYIPSMFLFVPVALFLVSILDLFSGRRLIQVLIIILTLSVFVSQGYTVFMRNMVISHYLLLLLDNAQKAPNLSRIHNNLGNIFFERGSLPAAKEEFDCATKLNRYDKLSSRKVTEYNLGRYFQGTGDEQRALRHYGNALSISPGYTPARHGMAMIALEQGDHDAALIHIRTALEYEPCNGGLHENMALTFLRMNRLDEALRETRRALEINLHSDVAQGIMAVIAMKRGEREQAIRYWKIVLMRNQKNIEAILALIELYDLTGDETRLTNMINRFMLVKGQWTIEEFITEHMQNPTLKIYNIDTEVIGAVIKKNLINRVTSFDGPTMSGSE